MEEIRLKESNVLKFGIKDANGKDTGNYLEFDLEDIELPLRYQELIEEDKKNRAYLKNQFTIIDRRQDHKGKKLLSANEEEKIKVLNVFYKKQEQIYDMFLGEGGVKKILNGRRLGLSTFDEIDEIIEKYIAPKLKVNADEIKKKIMNKYSKGKEEGLIDEET